MKPPEDVLYDSEVSLRMVARAMQELGAPGIDRRALSAMLRGDAFEAPAQLVLWDITAPQVDQIALVLFDLHQRLTRIAHEAPREKAQAPFNLGCGVADTD